MHKNRDVKALAFTPDSHGLICGGYGKVVEHWSLSPLVGEPGGRTDSPGVSKRDASNGSDTCTLKSTGREVHIGIEQVNLRCV